MGIPGETGTTGKTGKAVFMRGLWWFCASLSFSCLALASFTQDLLHASYLSRRRPAAGEFFAFYKAAQVAQRGLILYYPPPNGPARSLSDLRFDSTTPYGRAYTDGPAEPAMTCPFDNFPFSALLMGPIASLRWDLAYFVWRIFTALVCFSAVLLSSGLRTGGAPRFLTFIVGCALLTVFYPFREEVYLGETDGLVLLAWVAGALLLLRRCPAASSLCFALGTVMKIFPVLVLPLMVLRKQWRWLGYYAVWGLGLLGLSIGTLGWQNHIIWLTKVYPILSRGFEYFGNRSLPGLVFALHNPRGMLTYPEIPSTVNWVNKVLCGFCYVGFLWWCWTRRKAAVALAHETLLTMLVCLLVSPWTHREYYILATPLLLYLWTGTYDDTGAVRGFDLGLLSVATLVIGTPLPDYLAGKMGVLSMLAVMGLWVSATVGLVWLGVRLCGSPVSNPGTAHPVVSGGGAAPGF